MLGAFRNYLDITSLIPANRSAFFDFPGTNLVLTTVEGVPVSNRRISTIPMQDSDIPLLFQLKHLFHVRDIDGLSSLKTREEIMDFFGFSENTQPL